MKKLSFIIIALLLVPTLSFSQFKLGVRGGVNFNNVKMVNDTDDGMKLNYESGMGFHFGLTSQLSIANIFIQPEAIFSTVSNDVTLQEISDNGFKEVGKQKYNKLDIPLLAGLKFGALKVGAGPVGTIVLNSKSELLDKYEMDQKTSTWGYQLSAGFDFSKFNIELRYEGNFSKLGSGVKIGNATYDFDKRSSQVILTSAFYF